MEHDEDIIIPKSRRIFTRVAYLLFAAELMISLYCLSALSVFLVVLIKGGNAFDFESPRDYPAILQDFLVQAAQKLKIVCTKNGASILVDPAEWLFGCIQPYITQLEKGNYLPYRGGWTSIMRCALLMWHMYWWIL